MELATTQSVLMQIQPTIQRFARMLASVLQLEVEIVDENLCRVAGTGAYGKFLGRQLSGNSRLLRHVLETKTEKVVTQSRFDPLCEGCETWFNNLNWGLSSAAGRKRQNMLRCWNVILNAIAS